MLFGIVANNRLALWRTRRDEYPRDYKVFCDSFGYTVGQIKSEGTTLNLLILGEYPKHEAAASAFIHHLKGRRRREFQNQLNKYSGVYEELKGLGPAWVAATAAILPTMDSPTAPQDLDRYERERTQQYYGILEELMKIGKIKHWL